MQPTNAGFEQLLSRTTNIGWTLKAHFSFVPMGPEDCLVLIFLDVLLSYNQVCLVLQELQPANGNISILFPQASMLCYRKENSPLDLHLDAALILGIQEL